MLVAYDIRNDARRDQIAVALQEYGERVQFSVFMVDGRPATFVRVKARLRELMNSDVDSIMFCDLGPVETQARKSISYLGARRRLLGDSESLIF